METTGVTRVGSMRKRVVAGVAVVVALAALVGLSGVSWRGVFVELRTMDPLLVGAALVASLLAQLAWSSSTLLFLRSVDPVVPTGRVRLGYLTGTFAKQLLPFGHAGGVPLMAYVLAEETDLDYRGTFASVTASELVVFVASLAVAGVGFGWFVVADGVASGTELAALGLVAVLTLVALAVAGFVKRRTAFRRVVRGVAMVGRTVFRRAGPRMQRRLAPEAVDRGLDEFFETFDRATGDRRTVVWAATYAAVGWVLFALPLYLGSLAVGQSLPLALVLFVVPAAGLATLLPTPGGLGGTEVGLTAAVVLFAEVGLETAAAAVLVYRLCSYWFLLLVGGLSSLFLSAGLRELR
ncbi:lysylphosphatidylglycerol synthase transmembrane domain-containing protein [Haloprofundus salinisoli]|uniref:lysylphosphatidylglycerol synthase transmembrane domain-containing protein n=1 Tax=Haloprofundus salinisoli TaxID=2876193 RepID=UPI001CCA01D9|nr:lysylphosphatidylglycerol synthase transmembrane domain-containing protein [Haloprofundus salinisoli]